jgi:hypothetical protein
VVETCVEMFGGAPFSSCLTKEGQVIYLPSSRVQKQGTTVQAHERRNMYVARHW